MKDLLTNGDLAELMGWSEHTVLQRRYRRASMPRSIKLGNGTIRYRRTDVELWLDQHVEDECEPQGVA